MFLELSRHARLIFQVIILKQEKRSFWQMRLMILRLFSFETKEILFFNLFDAFSTHLGQILQTK